MRNYILENKDSMFYYLQTKYVEWKKNDSESNATSSREINGYREYRD